MNRTVTNILYQVEHYNTLIKAEQWRQRRILLAVALMLLAYWILARA